MCCAPAAGVVPVCEPVQCLSYLRLLTLQSLSFMTFYSTIHRLFFFYLFRECE